MCDILVALGNSTKDGSVIFGKNSDRPYMEAQLITYMPRTKYSKGEEVKCTYISIPQVSETAAIILSQSWWMWGAEMGVSEHGVAIGNEAIYTLEPLKRIGLLGMDLLRLGLERGKTAKNALEIITNLLEKHGQGGGCAYRDPSWLYHNSFIIADPNEAYVLETADKWWIVEKVKDVKSISNEISIRGKGDMRCEGIIQHAIEKGYCKDDDEFDFNPTFSGSIIDNPSPYSRWGKSTLLLKKYKGNITPALMMEFLREHEAGLCMHGSFESAGSQISQLKQGKNKSIHWFTGSTLPCLSIFKPYVFPADGQNILKPGPYSKINPEWFWISHASFLMKKISKRKTYINKLRANEREIISKINDVVQKVDKITKGEFVEKIKSINFEAWNKALEMIKT